MGLSETFDLVSAPDQSKSAPSESPDLENLEPQPAWFGTRELFDTDSDEEGPPPLVDESDSDENENQEAGRSPTPPSPPPQRWFRFLGRIPHPADQRGFAFLRQHRRPPDLQEDDVPGPLIGPIRPLSPDSIALEHIINATGGHGVLDSTSISRTSPLAQQWLQRFVAARCR
jgi:hypothetical protein